MLPDLLSKTWLATEGIEGRSGSGSWTVRVSLPSNPSTARFFSLPLGAFFHLFSFLSLGSSTPHLYGVFLCLLFF